MNEFVQKLKNSGNFVDAYLVAKNLLSKGMGRNYLSNILTLPSKSHHMKLFLTRENSMSRTLIPRWFSFQKQPILMKKRYR